MLVLIMNIMYIFWLFIIKILLKLNYFFFRFECIWIKLVLLFVIFCINNIKFLIIFKDNIFGVYYSKYNNCYVVNKLMYELDGYININIDYGILFLVCGF